MYLTRILVVAAWLAGLPAFAETTAFINVNVIPMTTNTVLRGKTVIVSDGFIQDINDVDATPIPENIQVVDGTDRYLMPGLSEMHGHVPAVGSDSLERVMHLYVANGVTLVRGMLGRSSHLRLRQQILDGELVAPRLFTSGPSFNGNSVSSPRQADEMARQQHAAGYDFLKIHPGLTRDEFDAVARAGNELGIPFAGHVPADVGLRIALSSGIATIDHLDGYMQTLIPAHEDPTGGFEGFFGLLLGAMADDAKIAPVVEATVEAGTWNVPTQSLFEHVASGTSANEMSAWPEMKYMPRRTVEQWLESKNRVVTDANYTLEVAEKAIAIRRKLIKALYEADHKLLLGSDSPQIFNVPGFVIHRELSYLVAAGLTPYDALRTGTVNPARFFGRGDVAGTVEVGREADLVLLDANPLEDISASGRVHGVMLRGRWISQTQIREMLNALER